MSSPIHDGSISPNDPSYYAPRRSGADVNTPVSDQLSAEFTTRTEEAEVIVPFPRAREYLNTSDHGTRRTWRTKAVTASAAVVFGGGLLFFGFVNVSSQPGEKRLPQDPVLSLASRLQTAAVDLQKASQQVVTPTLMVRESTGDIDMPLALGLEVKNYTLGGIVALSGLPAGTSISKGTAEPDGRWRISVGELPGVRVTPPTGYSGVMTVTAELRTDTDLPIVRSPVRLTWNSRPAPPPAPAASPVPAPSTSKAAAIESPARHLDPKEVAALLHRAEELKASGDIAAARLLLQRVAETNNARAAFELAETYDPVAMKKLGATGVAADPALAQYWYQRARAGKLPAVGQEPEAIASRATAGSN